MKPGIREVFSHRRIWPFSSAAPEEPSEETSKN